MCAFITSFIRNIKPLVLVPFVIQNLIIGYYPKFDSFVLGNGHNHKNCSLSKAIDNQLNVFAHANDTIYCLTMNHKIFCFKNEVEKHSYMTSIDSLNEIVIISNGCSATHAIFMDQNKKMFGKGSFNQQQSENNEIFLEIELKHLTKKLIETNVVITSISCGKFFTLFLLFDGRIMGWGKNSEYQCGISPKLRNILNPTFIPNLKEIQRIEAGQEHSLCLDSSQNVLFFGSNHYNQSTINTNLLCLLPTKHSFFQGLKISLIKCGGEHSLAINEENGYVFLFGDNNSAQIGNGSYNEINCPFLIQSLPHFSTKIFVNGFLGVFHSILLSKNNEIFTFGCNNNGQCSSIQLEHHITTPYHLKPTEFGLKDIRKIQSVIACESLTIFVVHFSNFKFD